MGDRPGREGFRIPEVGLCESPFGICGHAP